ncbi:MAG TPA: tetratricopeptide repeat protein [Candidatus Acidoferrales bacterium]|nr:tetratricopeptide repeat protein [Candidatus Acidoferrales bacterium]
MLKRRTKEKDLQKENLEHVIELGDARFRRGDFSEAIDHYDVVLECVPNNFRALHNKGLAFFALKKYDRSIECYDKALAIRPRELRVMLNKAISLNSKCDFNRAKGVLDEIIRLSPANKEARNARALSEFNLGLDTEGMLDLKKAIEIDPSYAMAWNNLGCFHLGLGELEAAIECFDRALAVDEKNYDALLLKNEALERQERRARRA